MNWILTNKYKTMSLLVFIVIAFFTALNSYTIVAPGKAKVGTLFGKVQPKALTEGFHIVNPLISFDKYSVKDFTVTWDNIKVPAQDKLKSGMDLAVTFKAKVGSLPNMKSDAGSLPDAFDKYVTPRVFSLLRECGKGVEKSQDFFRDEVQSEMQDFMLDNLREQLAPLGFEVHIALFSDVSLPPLVQAAIKATKKRQEEVNQEKAKLAIVALEQQKVVKVADANRDAAISNATAKKTNADAEAYAITAKATAQAEANIQLAKSVTPVLVDYIRANNWNGVLPTTTLGSTVPMVTLK